MLFDIPYIADWNKIGDYRQRQTDLNTKRENNSRIDYDYKVGGKVLVRKDGILRKTDSFLGLHAAPLIVWVLRTVVWGAQY